MLSLPSTPPWTMRGAQQRWTRGEQPGKVWRKQVRDRRWHLAPDRKLSHCLLQKHSFSELEVEDASHLETVWGTRIAHSRDSSVKFWYLAWTVGMRLLCRQHHRTREMFVSIWKINRSSGCPMVRWQHNFSPGVSSICLLQTPMLVPSS